MTYVNANVAEVGYGQAPLPFPATRFDDLATLLQAPPFEALVLTAGLDETRRLLRTLRTADSPYALTPIYTLHDQDAWIRALADGPVPGQQRVLDEQVRLHRERLALFNQGRPAQGAEALLLAYLWLRTPGRLEPLRDPGNPQHYDYPLARALGGEALNSQALVRTLAQRGWLQSVSLCDRIRLCRRCGSGMLNYVDVCTECAALDIQRLASLHCFTCGHIGRQGDFLKDGALVCPNCLSRLRHIGSDYDRPLENYACNQCQAFFIDADVQARCLDCGEQHAPDALQVRELRAYQLSENGRLAARQGLERNAPPLLDGIAMIGDEAFRTLLDWQLELIERHQAPRFALLGMRFKHLGRVIERLGPQRGHALLDALIERIQVAIRDTDRCTRTSEEQLWLLLMYTDAPGLQRVVERLNAISDLFVGQDLQDIELHTTACLAPEGVLEKENAQLLMARLAGELG
ncbi:diguanylate cyclase domain-containing protein [Pseudomonas sp. UBA6562]|uniref:TackOD1 domain-containing metal-binding protein n=1 Tax=Pseudomonas sp. UBA6562 TaxID=1947332 RepID=UPI0025DC3D00|nr:diguanylate cyclase [Pseudomonas sp. UBA6562]